MNIIHTTFSGSKNKKLSASLCDKPLPPYTVVGGNERGGVAGLSAILLNRGARYPRRSLFAELGKAGFDYVVSVESSRENYDLDELSTSFPFVKFILLSEPLTVGCQINIAVSEIKSPLFFVLWNDLKFLYGGCAEKIAERLLLPFDKAAEEGAKRRLFKRLCTVPIFQTPEFETLPTASSPFLVKKMFDVMPALPEKEDAPSFYPYDAVGIYDRQFFLEIGGFDRDISSEYWQLLDFGFRAWLWGEEIRFTQFVHLRHEGLKKIEDTSRDESYWRFFLKNLSPVLHFNTKTTGLYAHLPIKSFLVLLQSLKNLTNFTTATHVPKIWRSPLDTLRYFRVCRAWVREHKTEWKTSAHALIQEWKTRQ